MIGYGEFLWLRGHESRLGLPFFLAQITMRWHHVTGSPMGTGSRTPSLTSRSSCRHRDR